MSPSRTQLFILLLASILVPAVGCGGASTSTTPADEISPFAASLAPSQWKDGEWVFTHLRVTYHVWDDVGGAWVERAVKTGPGTLTMSAGGVGGWAEVVSLYDGVTEHTTHGHWQDGFAAGDTLVISGHIDGTTVGLIGTVPSGTELRMMTAPYDAYVEHDAAGRWTWGEYFEGVGGISLPGTYGGSATVSHVTWMGAAAGGPPPPVPVSFGSEPSVYMDGSYAGRGSTWMTHYDDLADDYEDRRINYDIELTITGDAVEGTVTITDLDGLSDFEGYLVGNAIPMKGAIVGSYIFLEASDPQNPGFSWRLVWSMSRYRSPVPESPGSVSEIYCRYGVHTRTATRFGGECYADLARQ